ncbi:MAG: NAD(P)H-dependent oxidoreductase subunit E [Candidatus Omnitrophica bacterium]|nr:NAD(P)H-dependent oxidoreductase subunit E [Candidatus Omnitrophota bacterium]
MQTAAVKGVDTKVLDKITEKYRNKPGALLGILEESQGMHPHKYLPSETLEYIAEKTGTPLSSVYSVVTFYAFFSLKPQGEHSIVVCRGTACHTRRSKFLLESLESMLGISEDDLKEGEKIFLTTKDNKYTVKTVACFGQCALAPVVEIDGVIHSHMTVDKLRREIGKLNKFGGRGK